MLETPDDPVLSDDDISDSKHIINFIPISDDWNDFIETHIDFLLPIAQEAFQEADIVKADDREDHINVIFCDDDYIHVLNKNYRQIDRPTNVLSFPTYSIDEIEEEAYQFGDIQIYGDIYIAYNYCLEEAKEIDREFLHHIAHMIVHGILHLFGFDHIEKDEAEAMKTIEIEILAKFNIPDPYEEFEDSEGQEDFEKEN